MEKVVGMLFGCLIMGAIPVLAECPSMDFTGDCYVDLADFAVFAEQWLTGNRLPGDMVIIPAGTFEMGDSFNEGFPDERPVHTVTLDSFAMGKYEITNEQYCAFLNSAFPSLKVVEHVVYASTDMVNCFPYCTTSAENIDSQIAYNGDSFTVLIKGDRDMSNDPMIHVSWYGAVAYCNWRSQQEGKEISYDLSTWTCDFTREGYRLATEAEWEYAARGGLEGMRFPWGNTITHSQANYLSYWESEQPESPFDLNPTPGFHPTWDDGIYPFTSTVGSFPNNGFGLFDMVGNVGEWCNDWWSDSYYGESPANNPTGPVTGIYGMVRGGGWFNNAYHCRVSIRGGFNRDYRSNGIGFRIVLGFN